MARPEIPASAECGGADESCRGPNPLARHYLAAALDRIAKTPGLPDRLGWWALHAHANEPWFRDELAFSLSQAYEGAFETYCEGGGTRHDIVVTSPASPAGSDIDLQPVLAAIELKVFGNWSLRPVDLADVAIDIGKIERARYHAIALDVCWHFVPHPNRRAAFARWIDRRSGTLDARDLQQRFVDAAGRPADFVFDATCGRHEDFSEMKLLCFGFRRIAPVDVRVDGSTPIY